MNINRRTYFQQMFGWSFAASAINIAPCASPHTVDWVDCVDVGQQELRGFEAEFPSMGSKINLRWYSNQKSQDQVVEEAKLIAMYWTSVLSDYELDSQTMLACFKADEGDWVPLSNDLWNVVKQCDQWHQWSEGAFDAALGAITRIRRQRKLATQLQWAKAKQSSGWNLLELDPLSQSIRFVTPGVRLDFGAIGKGIVVDRIAEKLLSMGIERYVVNAAGNMRMGLGPAETAGWPIAIDFPVNNPTESPIELLRMRFMNGGVATSGDRWQRFPDANALNSDDRSSHILEPSSGNGLSGHQNVTVFAENAADADAVATATCVRARRDLAGWLQTLSEHKPNVHAIIMLKENDSDPVRFIST